MHLVEYHARRNGILQLQVSQSQMSGLYYAGNWVDQNLGGSPTGGGALSSFDDDNCCGEHLIYASPSHHVHQLYFSGGWADQDLTVLAGGAPLALSGTALTNFADYPSSELIFYQDASYPIDILERNVAACALNAWCVFRLFQFLPRSFSHGQRSPGSSQIAPRVLSGVFPAPRARRGSGRTAIRSPLRI